MRILIAITGFFGGAPKSVLQYTRILKEHGHEVLVCGQTGAKDLVEQYQNYGIQTYETTYSVNDKNKFNKIRGVVDILECMIKWKCDLIIAVGVQLGAYISNAVQNLGIECLCLIPGGNLEGGKSIIKTIKCSRAIVFSEENKLQLEKYGFGGDIQIISNRIPATNLGDSWSYYSNKKADGYTFVLVSRLSVDKLQSVKYVIDFVEWLGSNGEHATLMIAGDGNCADELSEYARSKSGVSDRIHFVGWISDIEEYYKKADVCFGKGRSILEPLILGRYVVCVSEDKKMKWVETDSFSQLEYYNFSGRSIEDAENFDGVKEYLDNMYTEKSIEKLENTKCIAERQYGASYLERKFYDGFFGVYYENCRSKLKSKPSKIGLYAKVFGYWVRSRKV